jgi:hypothetical protein
MRQMLFLSLLMLGLVFVTIPVRADILVVDVDPPNTDTNPQWVTPSNPATEGAWLAGLLGFTVPFISKDEDSNPLDQVPAGWIYAVLKYGVGQPGAANPDHWAIQDDGDFILEFGGIAGLPTGGLSHVSYFGQPIPEPATMLLLGSGLIGLAGYGRKKFLRK